MKAECKVEKIQGIANIASRFTGKHSSLEVLSGVLLIAEGDTITLRATNLECGVEVSVQATVSEPGMVVLPAHTLSALFARGDGKMVSIESTGQTVTIRTENAVSTVKTLTAEDFPILPTVSGGRSFAVKGNLLSQTIRSVAFCASVSSIKPELQGVLLYSEAGTMYAVATDSFRLAEAKVAVTGEDVPKVLIPVRNAAELMRLLEGESGEVSVYYTENQLSLRVGGLYFTTRLIDGSFPDYRQILPKEYATEAVVIKEDMGNTLKALSVFSDKYSQVNISVDPKKKEVKLTARNSDVGEHAATMRAAVSGASIEMHFNGRYLADVLSSISGESIRLGFSGPGKPLAMTPVSGNNFVYILMPMNR